MKMKNIFQGYVEIEAPAGDTERAKWKGVIHGIVGDYVEDMVLPNKSLDTVATMNASINQIIKYRQDPSDQWQTPQETVDKLAGDCEDYAILKYAILRNSGFWSRDAALVLGEIARDPVNEPHAFLVVEIDGKRYILDNQAYDLVPATADGGKSFTTAGPNPDYINFQPKKMLCDEGAFLYSRAFAISDIVKKEGPA